MKNVSKGWAFVAMFFSIIGALVVLAVKKKDEFATFYAKQSIVLFLASVIVMVGSWVPVLGGIIDFAGSVILFALWIIGLVYVVQGKKKELPLIGQYSRSF